MLQLRSILLFSTGLLFYGFIAGSNDSGEKSEFLNSARLELATDSIISPFLFFSAEDLPALRAKIQSGWMKDAFVELEKKANVHFAGSSGPIPRGQTAGRRLNKVIADLAWTGYMKDELKYIQKAKDILLANAKAYTAADYYEMHTHLAMGDAAHAYAVGYDWLAPYLDSLDRKVLLERVEDLGAACYNHSMNNQYYGSPNPPAAGCNHNPVVNSSLGLCALVLGNRPEWLELAIRQTRAYFKYSLDKDGFNYEGMSYFAYGALGSTAFSDALLRSGGPDLLMESERVGHFALSVARHYLPQGGGVITIGDSDSHVKPAGGLMYIIRRYQSRIGLWAWLQLMGKEGDGTFGNDIDWGGASLPYTLIWADPELHPQSPEEADLPLNFKYESGRGFFRDGWGSLNSLVAFTCGYTTHRGHNQRDENTFSFYSRGEAFLIDPGYTPNNTIDHNGVLIDDTGQERPADVYDIYGKTIGYQEFDGAVWIKGDATDTYPDRLGIKRITRQLLFVKGVESGAPQPYVLLIDDIDKADDTPSTYSVLLQTIPKNSISVASGSKEATIKGFQGRADLKVRVISPDDYTFHVPNLTGVTRTGVRDMSYKVLNYYRTLEVQVTGADARVITLLMVNEPGKEGPVITSEGSPTDMNIRILFEDGTSNLIYAGAESVDFSKSKTTVYISSQAYSIDHTNQVISAGIAPLTAIIPVDLFLSYINPKFGAIVELIDNKGVARTAGDLNDGDQLRVTSADGETVVIYDLDIDLTSADPVGVGNKIRIFPNFTSGILTIQGVGVGNHIQIYNPTGSLIDELKAQRQSEYLSLKNVSSGIYLIVVSDDQKVLGRFKAIRK